jgi:hypothetical protein
MRLAIDDPSRLLRRQAGRQLPQQPHKLMLIFAHVNLVSNRSVFPARRRLHRGIGILQAIPSGPPPTRRSAPGG